MPVAINTHAWHANGKVFNIIYFQTVTNPLNIYNFYTSTLSMIYYFRQLRFLIKILNYLGETIFKKTRDYKYICIPSSFHIRIILHFKVFKPSTLGTAEDIRDWVNARIWFNMVDAQYHQSITHLGNGRLGINLYYNDAQTTVR